MDPLLVARSLQYYKRKEIQDAIVRHAMDREVSPRYGEGFGKRPDVLSYPSDVLEFAKRKATSFHVSEERWASPLQIKTGASRSEMNDLRVGWDLVLDIDAKDWEVSRLTAWLFIEALRAHGVTSITCKFSGNKGWHIGVPFEAFPATFLDDRGRDILTKDVFPEAPRAIATYLLEFMSDTRNGIVSIDADTITFGWREPGPGKSAYRNSYTFTAFSAMAGKERDKLLESYCPACKRTVKNEEQQYFLFCKKCGHKAEGKLTQEEHAMLEDTARICPKCKHYMDAERMRSASCPHPSRAYERRFRLQEVIEIDTVLLASRHLYRMAYSLHEKSGLASIVIDPDDVLTFDKTRASPDTIDTTRTFLDTSATIPGEAARLLDLAMQRQQTKDAANNVRRQLQVEEITEAIGEEHFPPCITRILAGLADGKKRAMFALTNFFTIAGWSPDMIEARLHAWNERNPEPLREVIIKGHMHQVRQKRTRIMPPNCKSFYQELGVCKPDELCGRIGNPGSYAIRHSQFGAKAKKPRRQDGEKTEVTGDGQTTGGKTAHAGNTPSESPKTGVTNAPAADTSDEGGEEHEET